MSMAVELIGSMTRSDGYLRTVAETAPARRTPAANVPLTIRPMDFPRDEALIVRYAKDLFAISFGSARQFIEQFGEGSAYVAWIAEKQALASGNAAIAAVGKEAVGMVVVGAWPDDGGIGYVFHYYLDPKARGCGLAPTLDAYAVSALRHSGFRTARLSVAATNERALRFYTKQGWSHAGPRPDQPGILYMERVLGS